MSTNEGGLNYKEAVAAFPEFPPVIIRKIDTGLRGVTLTERGKEAAKELGAFYDATEDLGNGKDRPVLGGALFRDGTNLLGLESVTIASPGHLLRRGGEPYKIDAIDGEIWLVDGDEPVEELQLVEVPKFYGKKTSRGTPVIKYVNAGPADNLNVTVSGYCHFWKEHAPCKYCSIVPNYLIDSNHTDESLADIREGIDLALEEEGRWTGIRLVAGSDPRGERPYENEVNEYIRVLNTLRESFGTEDIYARLVASAFPKDQLERLRDAGATSYEPHIEVWDKEVFKAVCPGKSKYYGWDYWVKSAIDAVDVFGRGHVCTQLVAGSEFAQPGGFTSIEEGLKSSLEGVEFFAGHGVTTSYCVLWVAKGSRFFSLKQGAGPLEYYIRLAQGMHEIRKKHRLAVDFNDYRRCAIHPDTDLSRLDYREVSYDHVPALDAAGLV